MRLNQYGNRIFANILYFAVRVQIKWREISCFNIFIKKRERENIYNVLLNKHRNSKQWVWVHLSSRIICMAATAVAAVAAAAAAAAVVVVMTATAVLAARWQSICVIQLSLLFSVVLCYFMCLVLVFGSTLIRLSFRIFFSKLIVTARRGEGKERNHDNRKCNSFNSHFGFLVYIQNTTYPCRLARYRENGFGRWCVCVCRNSWKRTTNTRKIKAPATLLSLKC